MKRLAIFLLCGAFLTSLTACQLKKEEVAPHDETFVAPQVDQDTVTQSENKTSAPVPKSVVSAEVTEQKTYDIRDFFDTNKKSLIFNLAKGNKTQQTFCEFSVEKKGIYYAQNKIFVPGAEPKIEIVSFDGQAIGIAFEKKNVPYCYSFIGSVKSDPDIILKAPIQIGNKWKIAEGESYISAIDQLVQLPLGQVHVVEVTSRLRDGRKMIRLFLENIGVVATYEYDKNGVMTSSLEAVLFDENNAYTQKVRFYYANKNREIVYLTKEIRISNNPSMENIFRNHLQAVPGDLIALEKGINIKSIKLVNGAVRVNFSAQLANFVENEELTRWDERTFLQALADTFGDYYKVKKVYIYIEGDPYASATLVLTGSDYFVPEIAKAKSYPQ